MTVFVWFLGTIAAWVCVVCTVSHHDYMKALTRRTNAEAALTEQEARNGRPINEDR